MHSACSLSFRIISAFTNFSFLRYIHAFERFSIFIDCKSGYENEVSYRGLSISILLSKVYLDINGCSVYIFLTGTLYSN